jgi:23S rRNA pseudouridine1911/1915/1917 synthase
VIVHGHPQPEVGEWHDRIVWNDTALLQRPARANDPRGIDAACEYRVVEGLGATALLEVRLHTGKQNQIRVQAQMHGHPLVGERRYIDRDGPRADRSFPRQALHAYRLAFRHPADDREIQFEAPIPKDLRELLARLRRSGAGE